jgi:hypothetical protein
MSGNPAERKPLVTRAWVFRQLRLWHGYLSAIAFLALIFFSATGILLNHPPDPDAAGAEAPPATRTIMLTADERARVLAAAEKPAELARIVAGREKLAGAFLQGEVVGDDLFVRFQGVKGTSDLIGHLATGEVEVTVSEANPVSVMNELHRGERAGPAWRFAIDAIAVVLIVMSLIGWAIFLTLRLRLMTALVLTGLSGAALAGLFVFVVH